MDDIDKMSREELIDYINKLNRTLSKMAEETDNADTAIADLAIELEQCFPYPRDANGYSIKVGDGLDWNGVHGICVGYEWYKRSSSMMILTSQIGTRSRRSRATVRCAERG